MELSTKPIPLLLDIFCRAVGEGRYRRRGGIARHGRENGRANDEKIGHVVGLAVTVDYRIRRIGSHPRAAALPSRRWPWKLRPDFAGAGFAQDPFADIRQE